MQNFNKHWIQYYKMTIKSWHLAVKHKQEIPWTMTHFIDSIFMIRWYSQFLIPLSFLLLLLTEASPFSNTWPISKDLLFSVNPTCFLPFWWCGLSDKQNGRRTSLDRRRQKRTTLMQIITHVDDERNNMCGIEKLLWYANSPYAIQPIQRNRQQTNVARFKAMTVRYNQWSAGTRENCSNFRACRKMEFASANKATTFKPKKRHLKMLMKNATETCKKDKSLTIWNFQQSTDLERLNYWFNNSIRHHWKTKPQEVDFS